VINKNAAPNRVISDLEFPEWIETLLVHTATQTYKPIVVVSDWVNQLNSNLDK